MSLSEEDKKKEIEKRFRTDPLNWYRPGKTVTAYLQSTALYRALSSANQVGKTTAIQYECAAMARGKHPYKPWCGPVRILVLIPSRAQAAVVWGGRLLKASELYSPDNPAIAKHPFIPKREIEKVHNAYSPIGPYPGCVILKNKSTIYFALSGDINSWKRLEGMIFDYVFRDEADGNENLGDEIQPRLLRAQSNALKPWAGGMAWAATETKVNDEWSEFKNRCKDGIVTGVGKHEYFFIKPEENPAISADARSAMAGTMSEESFKIRGTGEETAGTSLLIFQNWSRDRHIRKEPYVIGIDDNLWISYDPGWRHPVGILCCAINKREPNKIHVVAFYSYRHGTRSEHLATMAEWLDGRFLTGLVCDPAIRKTESNGRSYFSMFEEEIPDHGIRLQRPLCIGRNRLEDMLPQLEQFLEQGLIDVDPHGYGCDLFIKQIENYQWDAKSKERRIYRKAKGGDEAPDCLKYLASKYPVWGNFGPNPQTGVTAPVLVDGPDGSVDLSTLSADERLHRERLKLGAEMYDDVERAGDIGIGIARY